MLAPWHARKRLRKILRPPEEAKTLGLRVGMVGTVKFEARIKGFVENLPDLAVLVEPLLVVRRALREHFVILHRRLLAIVRMMRCAGA